MILQADTTPLHRFGRYVPVNTVHYLAPSILLAVALGVVFLLRHQRPLQRVLRISGHVAPVVVPRLLAATTFLAGAILLFSGATPAPADRLGWLLQMFPLPVVELSHFLGSLAGAGLLILARGLWRRLDAAYHLTIALLGAGILFCLLQELNIEEAILLSAMLAALLASRRFFYRKASLLAERFTPPWIAAILLVVLGSIVLGVISYGAPDISAGTFWHFSPRAAAPRFLRATTGVLTLLVIVAGMRLIRPARARPALPSAAQLDGVSDVVAAYPEAFANLVYLGDKALLFNEDRTGFVMYGVARRSWIALGDPVAPPEGVPDLALRFIRACDRHGAWPVFYKVGGAQLHHYLDIGFSVAKLGEEARVSLGDFSLDGPERRNLRRVWRKAEQDGCTFEVCAGRRVAPRHLDEHRLADRGRIGRRGTPLSGGRCGVARARVLYSPHRMSVFTATQVPEHTIASAVDTVFRGGAYHRFTYVQRFLGWAGDQLLRFFSWIYSGYHALRAWPVLFWPVVTGVAALLIAIVARAVWLWHRHRMDLAEGASWARGESGPQWRDPWMAAQQLAAAGDYTGAAHALYAALLESAARTGQIRLHPSKTVGDYVRELRSRSSSLFVRFREFARSYEVVVYRVGSCDETRYQRLLALAVPIVRPDG